MSRIVARLFLFLLILLAGLGCVVEWVSAIRFQRGRDYFDAEDMLRARWAFESSLQIPVRNPEPHRWLAKTCVRLIDGRNRETQLQLLRNAEQELEQALAIESRYPYYWYELARVGQLIERLGEKPGRSVLDCYHQAVVIDHNNPIFLQYLGEYLLGLGRKEEARSVLKKLVDIDLNYSLNLVRAWMEKGHDPGELTGLFAGKEQHLVRFTDLLVNSSYYKSAEEVSRKAFELYPHNPEARLIYGRSFIAAHECGKAGEILKPLFSMPTYQVSAYGVYALCLYYAREYEVAAEQYLQLIRLQPAVAENRALLANCYIQMNKPELAKEQLVWLVNQPEPADENFRSRTYIQLAGILEKENDREQALKYYRLYLQLNPQDKAVAEKVSFLEKSKPGNIIYSPWEMKNEKTP
jgi:tetratricopeptide (TPR) repeat protein